MRASGALSGAGKPRSRSGRRHISLAAQTALRAFKKFFIIHR
jgi:hypothetical protein